MRHLLRRIIAVAAALSLPAVALVATTALPAAAAPTGFTSTLVGDVSCQLAEIDLATGVLTPFGPVSADHCARDLAFAPDGTLYGIVAAPAAFMQLVRFDTTTGAVTVIGQITSFGFTEFSGGDLTFDNTGTLYAQFAADDPSCSASGQFCLYQVDPNTAAATFVGTVPFQETVVRGLAGACDGRVLTQFFGAADQIQAFLGLENQLNAQVTTIGSIGPENTVLLGFDFDTAGNLWGLGDTSPGGPSKVFTVDQSTGTATPGPDITGAPQGPTVSGLAIAPLTCPLPEPVVVQPTFTG